MLLCIISCHLFSTASQNNSGLNYFILLIITDGAITDMDKTKAAIVAVRSNLVSIYTLKVSRQAIKMTFRISNMT